MAQFMGTVQGNRGEASRLGSKKSGLDVNCNGWRGGVRVCARHEPITGTDVFHIYATSGSGHGENDGYIGEVIDGKFISAENRAG